MIPGWDYNLGKPEWMSAIYFYGSVVGGVGFLIYAAYELFYLGRFIVLVVLAALVFQIALLVLLERMMKRK